MEAAYCRLVAEQRRPGRRRWWPRRSALPRSRSALALGALVAAILLALLLLGLTRAEPGRDLPGYQPPSTTTTTTMVGPVPPPVITRPVPTAAPTSSPP